MNNRNIIIDLAYVRGAKIRNISQYNNAFQSQNIQNQHKLDILKYKNETNIKKLQLYEIKKNDIKKCNC